MQRNNNTWQGYTIEEIRHRRAINSLKMDVMRERIMNRKHRVGAGVHRALYGNMLQNVFKSLSMAEYAFLLYKGFKQVEKLMRLFRRR